MKAAVEARPVEGPARRTRIGQQDSRQAKRGRRLRPYQRAARQGSAEPISDGAAPAAADGDGKDIVIFDLDSNPLTHSDKPQYSERFIHSEIYKVRPDVVSVVHCHARPLIPFGTAKGAKLRPMFHMCGFLGCGVPICEIRKAGGMTDMLVRTAALGKALAASLGDKNVVLMRGHGATMVGESIPEAVFRAVYATENASIQMQAHLLADNGEVEFLSDEEAAKSSRGRNVPRAWSLWKHEMTGKL